MCVSSVQKHLVVSTSISFSALGKGHTFVLIYMNHFVHVFVFTLNNRIVFFT